MLLLDDYLRGRGVDLTGWRLGSATAVSGEGTIIAGWGFHDGFIEGWVVQLTPGTAL
jgi:hypothetical protein